MRLESWMIETTVSLITSTVRSYFIDNRKASVVNDARSTAGNTRYYD